MQGKEHSLQWGRRGIGNTSAIRTKGSHGLQIKFVVIPGKEVFVREGSQFSTHIFQ